MAEIIGVASSIVALVTLGVETSKTLYDTIETLKNHTKTVRDLKLEVRTFQDTLKELEDAIGGSDEGDFASLKLPLHSCVVACQDFELVVRKCTSNTTETRRSLRDWAKLQLRGTDINGFRTTLAGYKSTIQIALGGINLSEYRGMIRDTKADLEEHLCQIEEQLQKEHSDVPDSVRDLERHRIEQEKESAIRCLEICDDVSEYIERHQSTTRQGASTLQSAHISSKSDDHPGTVSSDQITASTLSDCHGRIRDTRKELEAHLALIQDRSGKLATSESKAEENRVRQCLSLCDDALRQADRARVNLVEDVRVADDSLQFVVSTIGDLISAKRVTAGSRATQMLGQMSDESLQQSLRYGGSRFGTQAPNPPKTDEQTFSRYGSGQYLGRAVGTK